MYIKHGQELTQLVDPENLYELFHLSPQDREIYQSMNESFNSYVNGGEDAYEKIVEPYRKKMYEWDRLKGESIQFTQIFAAKDLNFKEEDSMVMRLDETQTKVKAVMNLKSLTTLECSALTRSTVRARLRWERYICMSARQKKKFFTRI